MIHLFLIPFVAMSGVPTPWHLSGRIGVPSSGEDVVANYYLDRVCVTRPGEATVPVYNSSGEPVAIVPGVPERDDESIVGDWWIVMNDTGYLTNAKETSQFVTSRSIDRTPIVDQSRIGRREYFLSLIQNGYAKSTPIKGPAGLRFIPSVRGDEALFRSENGHLQLVAWRQGQIRVIRPWLERATVKLDAVPVASLAGKEYLALAFVFDSTRNTLELPGIPIFGVADANRHGMRMDVQYVVSINSTTGRCVPIAGFMGWDDGYRRRLDRSVAVFNSGKAIAVNHLGTLYILRSRD